MSQKYLKPYTLRIRYVPLICSKLTKNQYIIKTSGKIFLRAADQTDQAYEIDRSEKETKRNINRAYSFLVSFNIFSVPQSKNKMRLYWHTYLRTIQIFRPNFNSEEILVR